MTTAAFEPATGGYTRVVSVVNNTVNLRLDPNTRAPRTDEFSIGVDREVGRRFAASIAYVHKDGANFIGWTDVGGQYLEQTRQLPDGRSVPVLALDTAVTPTSARRFLLTNPAGYSLTYNGLVMALEKRRSNGWHAFGSYTLSKAYGLLPSSGTTAAGAQVSTVSPPQPLTFGRDPNDLTNARGRLPNDRPHVLRAMGSVDIPRTGSCSLRNLQYFSGKPWAATALVALPQSSRLSASCSSRAARDGCRRRRCSICGCRGRSRFGGAGTHRVAGRRAQCAQRRRGRRPGDGQSVQRPILRSPLSSWIRVAR